MSPSPLKPHTPASFLTRTAPGQRASVCLLHTGGTFGMSLAPNGINSTQAALQPTAMLTSLLKEVPELSQMAQLHLDVLCNKDSSDLCPDDWVFLAREIEKRLNDYDGFVIIHGTDTMAYTAAALSYFFQGITKPLVLTGSQRPLHSLRNDARLNIINAVELATRPLPLVMVCFHNTAYLGTRISKQSNNHMQAFQNFQGPLVGEFGVDFRLNHLFLAEVTAAHETLKKQKKPPITADLRIDSQVLSLTALPGQNLSPQLQEALMHSYHGFVVRAFGGGHLPLESEVWRTFTQTCALQQKPLVILSQSIKGPTTLDSYENGRWFLERGVLPANDMSAEAATVKLMVMLGRGIAYKDQKDFFATPLAWECQQGNTATPEWQP